MFRIPYFAQKCLAGLEKFGQSAVPRIEEVLTKNSAFDDLKVGLITVLGSIHTPESFGILAKLIDHEKPYLVRWAGQALEKHNNPDALPFLNKAQERLAGLNQVAGAIRDLAGDQAG
jgi:HEAT repeat protein